MGVSSESPARRNRTKYTIDQLNKLEKTFTISQYPDTDTMDELAELCNVSLDKISTWFQNRRSKFKRQSKDSNISWMRQHIYNRSPDTAADHVLSAPTQSSVNDSNIPKSNLHHRPDVRVAYPVPATPVYPPIVTHDMFNDIIGDIISKPALDESSTPVGRPQYPSPTHDHHLVTPSSSSSSSPCSMGSPDHTSFHDTSTSSLQTTPPSQHRLHPAFPMSQQPTTGLQSIYLNHVNQIYQWQCFQTSMAMAQCMHRY